MKKGEDKWYKSPSNWFIVIACIILVPILLINLCIMFQSMTNKDEVPNIFGFKPFMVLSGSMESEIHKGDLIITKIIDADTVQIDDVIAFRDAADTVTTHRVIDIVEKEGSTYFITKGDNNSSQDQNLVALEDVEGLYIGRLPGIGSIMDSLAKPTVILILVFGITAIFVIGFMISNKKQMDAERREFLEYKMRKELEEKKSSKKKKKIVEEDDDDDEDDEDEEEIEEIKKGNKKKTGTTSPVVKKDGPKKKKPSKKA